MKIGEYIRTPYGIRKIVDIKKDDGYGKPRVKIIVVDDILIRSYMSSFEFYTDEKGLKNCKKVAQYDIDGNLINIYNSVINASKETNISQANISSCALGKRNKAGGFIWKYLKSKGE